MLLGILISCALSAQSNAFHDFVVETIDGKPFAFSQLKGKKVLIVNVASRCGLTPQYTQLQLLYEKYKDSGFVIIGFPSNDFMNQEPGTNEEIAEFCTSTYGVTFPIMAKISVKGDEKTAPLYRWLTEKERNGKEDAPMQWNFQKFMIDEEGTWVGSLAPNDKDFGYKVSTWIEQK